MITLKHSGIVLGKLLGGGLAFLAGMILGGIAATLAGLRVPALPTGADQATLNTLLVPISLLLSLTLSRLARGLSGSFPARWLMLASLTWMVYSVNTVIEGAIFTTFAAVSIFTVVTFLSASLLCGAAMAWLFPPEFAVSSADVRALFATYSAGGWVWRLGLAWLAFPLIYLAFGRLVAPFVIGVYQQQQLELTAPGWGAILATQALRSVLLLAVCLPMIVAWHQSRRRLLLTLGWALFVLVGLLYMLQAHWMPLGFRLAHSLEILADSFVYTWVLVTLLWNVSHTSRLGSGRRSSAMACSPA